jgi:DNA-binding SARP family transcriptional activator
MPPLASPPVMPRDTSPPEQRNHPPAAVASAQRPARHNPAIPVGAGLAVGAVGLLAALERRRRVANRRRRPGTRLRLPDPPLAATEVRLRTQARDVAAVADTIRLAVALVADKDDTVTVRAAWHHADGAVELVLDTAREPAPPFTSTDRGWRLAAADHGFTLATSGRADPAPALTPVGTDADGAVCYVNLEVPGLIGVDGELPDVAAVTAGIVRALAGAPWANELAQVVVPERMSRAVIGLDRVDVLADPPILLDHLTVYADRVARSLDGQPSLAVARRSGDADTVGVAVLAGLSAAELPDRLRDAATSPTGPIVVILAGTDPHAQTWTVVDNKLAIPGVSDGLTPLRADADEIEETARLLEQALDATPSEPDDPHYAAIAADCPPEPESRPVEVRVLGPVEVAGTDRVRRKPVLGLIVYLALHRRPVGSEQLSAALWPDREHNGHVLRSRMSEARAALDGGIDHEGRTWMLADTVGCDWQRFRALAAGSRDEQLEALALVRGRPFHGYDAEWLHTDGYMHEVEAAIVDLALTVAEDALADDDPATATTAALAGLRACPYDERLYQLAMSAAAARGATSEVRALRERHDRVLEDEIEPDDHAYPETVEVYEQAIRGDRRAIG